MSLSTAERFARYFHQPPAWASHDHLNDWHASRAHQYQATTRWANRNRRNWEIWCLAVTPRQRRRIRKGIRADYQKEWRP